MRWLQTRLQSAAAPGAFGSALGAQQVDLILLVEIQEAIEVWVDSILSLIYELPITSPGALIILRSIVCKLVVSDLIPVHYFATSNPQIGGDSGFGAVIRSEGIKELERYTFGYGVDYPSTGTGMKTPRKGVVIQQCIPLPGVARKATSEVNRTLSPFECYAVEVEPVQGSRNYIDWGI